MTVRTTRVGDPAQVREAEARSRAGHPTGRPAPTGRRARRAARPALPLPCYLLGGIVAVLALVGLGMVLSASSVMALHTDGSSWGYFQKQALWTVLGFVAFFVAANVPYQAWRRFLVPGLFLAFLAMVLVLVPSIGREANGARAWLELGPLSFQPAELMKLVMILYCAEVFSQRAERMNEVRSTLVPTLVVLGAAGLLIMLQPDLGSGLVLTFVVLTMAFIAGAPLVPLAAVGAALSVVAVGFVTSTPYRRDRWIAFLDLAKHKQDEGFQVWQSLVGIASGGLSGVGLGAGKAKWGFLPEAHTDFIFAVIAEEMGFVGVVLVIGLILAFGVLGVRVALRAPDRFGLLLAAGVTVWILLQALVNIGGVVGMMPLTGLTLPFVSFGGSSLLVSMAAAGILVNVARHSR